MSSVQQYKDYNKKLKNRLRIKERVIETQKRSISQLNHRVSTLEYTNSMLKKLLNHYMKEKPLKTWWLKNIMRKDFEI